MLLLLLLLKLLFRGTLIDVFSESMLIVVLNEPFLKFAQSVRVHLRLDHFAISSLLIFVVMVLLQALVACIDDFLLFGIVFILLIDRKLVLSLSEVSHSHLFIQLFAILTPTILKMLSIIHHLLTIFIVIALIAILVLILIRA